MNEMYSVDKPNRVEDKLNRIAFDVVIIREQVAVVNGRIDALTQYRSPDERLEQQGLLNEIKRLAGERDELKQVNKNLRYGSDLIAEERDELKEQLREAKKPPTPFMPFDIPEVQEWRRKLERELWVERSRIKELETDVREARRGGSDYRDKWLKCRSALESLRGRQDMSTSVTEIITEALK